MSAQGTAEWLQERCGLATASRFKDVLATVRSGEAAGRRNYRAQLVVERLTGQPQETYQNAAMAWGTEHEPYARIAYEAHTGLIVQEVGFIKHPTLMAGCSPDGLVEDNGLVEIKAPYQSAVHIDALLGGIVPPEHIPQIMGQLWLTGREYCDFVSYDSRLPERLQLFVYRVHRDEKYIFNLEGEVIKFLKEVDAKHKQLMALAEKQMLAVTEEPA